MEKLERKLAEHDARHKEVLADITERRAELDAEETALRGAYASKRRDLQQRLADARAAVEAESR